MAKLAAYWKGIIAGLGAVAIVTQTVLDNADRVTAAIAVLTAAGVFFKANEPKPVA